MVIYELLVVIVSLFRDINSDKGNIVEIDVVDIVFKDHKVPIVVRGCLDCKVLEGDAVGIVEFYCGILGVSGIACQDCWLSCPVPLNITRLDSEAPVISPITTNSSYVPGGISMTTSPETPDDIRAATAEPKDGKSV